MTLQTKLVISFTVLLLAVIAAVGVAASRSIETILVAQTDRTLTSFVTRGPEPQPDRGEPEPIPDQPEPPSDEIRAEPEEPFLRSFAELFIAPDGENPITKHGNGLTDRIFNYHGQNRAVVEDDLCINVVIDYYGSCRRRFTSVSWSRCINRRFSSRDY